MKIVYNIYVAVRKLWNAIFGKNGDGSQLVIPGRISGASGDVTVGEGLNLTSDVLKSTVPVVSANPVTAESDPELSGLQIGNTKYKVPSGGGDKYIHRILSKGTRTPLWEIDIINSSSEKLTVQEITQYLNNLPQGYVINLHGQPSYDSAISNIRFWDYAVRDSQTSDVFFDIFSRFTPTNATASGITETTQTSKMRVYVTSQSDYLETIIKI